MKAAVGLDGVVPLQQVWYLCPAMGWLTVMLLHPLQHILFVKLVTPACYMAWRLCRWRIRCHLGIGVCNGA